uniref:NME/NM23 family member 5 n=1 Tax=Electrophorus electricus TaxID=8005 RepID=A0A4W4DXY1_ELEEL
MHYQQTPKLHLSSPHIFVERTLALIKPDAADKAEEIESIILRSGFTVLQRKPCDPFIWLADWLMKNNPNKPSISSGTEIQNEA